LSGARKRLTASSKRVTAAKAKVPVNALGRDIRQLILAARESVARTVNAGLTMLYWQIGDRIRREILNQKRAEYGEQVVHALSDQLSAEFGRGFGKRNLFRMIRFAEVFPERKIVSALLTQLGWTHLLQIIAIDDPLKRDFYTEMCRIEGSWMFSREVDASTAGRYVTVNLFNG